MAAADQPKTFVVSGIGRLSYAHLHEPSAVKGSDKMKFNTAFMWPKTDLETTAKMNAAYQTALLLGVDKKCWQDAAKIVKTKTFKAPIYDGDIDQSEDTNYAGMWYINAKSDTKPGLYFKEKSGPRALADTEKALVYSGANAKVSVNFYPFNNVAVGVGVGLNNVMVTGGGEAFGSKTSGYDDFAEEGDVSDFAEEADFDPEA